MKLLTGCVVQTRSDDHNIDIFHQSTVMQCLGCKWIIILGFSPVVYPSSNWGGGICAVLTSDVVANGEIINYFE